MEPMEGHGLQAMSIGFLIDADTPMVWRGPMVTQALEQLLKRDQVARPRLPGGRPAAGHRRHPADARAEGAGHRRRHRHHAAGHRADRRAQGPQDVREGRHPDPRHRREHGDPRLLELRPRGAHLRRRRRRAHGARTTTSSSSARCRSTSHPRAGRFRQADRGRRPGRPRRRRSTARSRARSRSRSPRRRRTTSAAFPKIVIQNTDVVGRQTDAAAMSDQVRQVDPPHGGEHAHDRAVRAGPGQGGRRAARSSPTAPRATATTSAARTNSRSSPTSTRPSSIPRTFDAKSFVDFKGDVCIIPPNSFALARTVEYFRIPRNVLTICLGKSHLRALRHHRQRDAARAGVGGPRDAGVLQHHAAAGARSTPTRASRR